MTSTDTRTHIIHTGADLIGHKGFGATGINAVLTAAGVPKGSFYHYFSSKNDFGLAVIDTFAEEYDAKLDRILNDTSRSCVDRLRAYFDTGFETMTSCEYTRGCLIGNLGQELADRTKPSGRGWTRSSPAGKDALSIASVLPSRPETSAPTSTRQTPPVFFCPAGKAPSCVRRSSSPPNPWRGSCESFSNTA